jgi:hypothetical protein
MLACAAPGLVGLRRAREHRRPHLGPAPQRRPPERRLVGRQAGDVADGGEQEVGLALARREAGEAPQELGGPSATPRAKPS